ncbi:MAG: vitamin K epoxide reductase family protein [Patescibacteria group bacterium]
MNRFIRPLIILATAGLLVSIYLTFKTYDPASVACSIGGGCETVLSSSYAKIFGIPVSIFGIVWYIGGLILIYLALIKGTVSQGWIKYWAVAGLAFSLYLLAMEIFYIHAYCTWCMVSLGIVTASLILVFWPQPTKTT